jgi:hypothetical protein
MTVLGAIPTALGALVFGGATTSSDPNAGWEIFIVLALWGIGIPFLLVGLTVLLVGRIRARRGDLASNTTEAESTNGNRGLPIAGIALAWFPLAGLPLSLYGFFGNRAGTKARQLGLVGLVLNLVLMFVFTRL